MDRVRPLRLFQRHKTNIHSKTKIACPICGFETNAVNQLTKHIWLAHDKWNPHKCAYCTFKCGTEAQLRSHIDSEHDEKAMAKVHLILKTSQCTVMSMRQFTKILIYDALHITINMSAKQLHVYISGI